MLANNPRPNTQRSRDNSSETVEQLNHIGGSPAIEKEETTAMPLPRRIKLNAEEPQSKSAANAADPPLPPPILPWEPFNMVLLSSAACSNLTAGLQIG